MSRPVFISYSREASAAHAQALAARLDDLAFFDTDAIDDGAPFPQRLLDGILDASVVVIFAAKEYAARPFCRLEMRLALAGGDEAASHLVLALGSGCGTVLDAMPAAVAGRSWPAAGEAERLEALVRRLLSNGLPAIRQRLAADEAQRLATAFLEESSLPGPQSLHGIVCSFPPGVAAQSIGARFVGRADGLRSIHRVLSEGTGSAARLTSRITAGGGFGKTRLVIEYLHRYARYYPGGIFWVSADSSDIEGEFWRVLRALDSNVPDLAVMRAKGRDVRGELELALRKIGQPALYVIDNIPEAGAGADPPPISDFCPAVGAVAILATSRQDTREAHVRTIRVDILERDSAILLLTDNVQGAAALSWADWGRIAEWVGDLPIALDLLNRSLALGSIAPRGLLERVHSKDQSSGATGELDGLREALRGQVPADAVRGVTEAFLISFEKLDPTTQEVAQLLAQLAPAPVPEAFMKALLNENQSPAVRAALRGRHWVTGGDALSFGTMHRLMADFVRSVVPGSAPELLELACTVLEQVMTRDRCLDPRDWPVMRLCRPHAEMLFARGSAMDVTALGLCAAASEMGLKAALLDSAQGDRGGARRLGERVLEVTTRVLGEEHPRTLMSMNNLAATLWLQGDYGEARRIQQRVLEVMTRVLGEEHKDTLMSMNNLALTLTAQRDHAGARRLQELVVQVSTRVLGEEHPQTLTAMNNLAATLWGQGDHAGARRLLEGVLEVTTRVLGEEHPETLRSMHNLAATLGAQGDRVAERRLQERVLEVSTRVLGEEHPHTLASMDNLAVTLNAQGDLEGAIRLLRKCLLGRRKVLGEDHPDTAGTAGLLRLLEASL